MSEDTAVVETPEVEVETTKAVKDVVTIESNPPDQEDLTFNIELHERKKKGKDEQQPVAMIQLQTDISEGDTINDDLAKFVMYVGAQNFWLTVLKEVVRPACYDASADGFEEKTLNAVKFWEAIKEYFNPRSAKTGSKLKDILSELGDLGLELAQLYGKGQQGELEESDENRLMQITVRMAELGELKAKKERKGKATPKAKKA
mgnify:CR=1 FL=1